MLKLLAFIRFYFTYNDDMLQLEYKLLHVEYYTKTRCKQKVKKDQTFYLVLKTFFISEQK